MVATVAMAHDFEVGGIYYDILSEEKKTVEVTYRGNYSSYSNEYTGSVDIPSSVISNGITYAVTSIGDYAFDDCSGLTSITIPNSVTSIGWSAFEDCTGLTSVTIPNSVTSIGYSAFYGCSGLTSVTIPNSVTSIGDYAFSGTAWLNNQPDGVIYAGKVLYTYKGTMPENTNISIKEGTLGIAGYAFSGCSGLTSITIGNSVTSIGDYAFGYCSGLTSITIPNCVTSIGDYAFSGCTGLKEVHISDLASWCNIDFDYTSSNPLCHAQNLYLNGELVTELIIPNGVSKIKNYAFSGCSGLTSIKIPNSVTSIGSDAFLNCSNLKKAIWLTNTPPTGYNNVGATINYVANDQYSGLSNVKVYPYLSSLFEVGGVKYVPVSPAERTCDAIDCVYDSTALDINIEKTVLFKGIAMNVKQVMPYTFYANKNIKTIKVDNDGIVGNYAFNGCTSLNSATISNNGYIGERAFSGCTTLASVEISNNGNVGIYAFNGCTSLNSAIISNNGSVRDYAFSGCTTLASVEISNNGNVGIYAFNGCTSLSSATISNNGGIGGNAFRNCSSLVTATLGDSIASIGASAFYGCSKLSEIVIPDAVTAIGYEAFENCKSLETVKVGNGTKSINSYAFGGCSALSSITLGDSVTTIGSNAFYACSSLPEIVIPQSVTKINSSAFDNCTALADVIIEDRTTALSLGSNGSSPLFSDCPLDSVYIGGKITYSTSSSYGYSPFYRNTSLRSVVITDTEEEVYDNEFYGCSNLKNVSIGNGVKKIGNWAFSGCSALDYFAFGNSVQSIGEEAFSDCNNVTQIISRAKTPPTCGAQALDDINKWSCTLWVPEKYKAEYQSAEQWKEFFFVEGIAEQTYTVTFIVDGEVYDTLSVEYGEKITLPDTPVKEGHTFSGWSGVPEIMPAEDITITGTFTVNTYVVTYIVDGTVYVTDSIAYGEEIVPRDEPTKEGHTFSGWSEAPETMPAEDIVIEGSFFVNSYTITYKVDGEVYATDSIAYGSEIVLRDEPVKEGHTFSGWSEAPETMPAEDIVIEGSFSVNSYSITYKVDGEVYETVTAEYGTAIEPIEEPTKEGHTFSGWSEAPETMPAEDIVIEGSFSVNSYSITYKVDGEVYETVTAEYGTAIEPIEEPTKEGHTFSGWSDVPETMPAEDIIIEGTFSINSYTVTFMIDGEVYETATVEFGAEIELPTPPEKDGYIFGGWVGVPDSMPAQDVVIEGEYIVDTTGINDVKTESSNVRTVYDLQGRKVDNPTNGIYIVNGKKVFLK